MNNIENNTAVMINLDRPRELRLSHSVLKKFCAATGTSVNNIEATLNDYQNIDLLLHLMLRRDDPDLTDSTIDDLLDGLSFAELISALEAAMEAAFDSGEDPQQAPAQSRRSGAGD